MAFQQVFGGRFEQDVAALTAMLNQMKTGEFLFSGPAVWSVVWCLLVAISIPCSHPDLFAWLLAWTVTKPAPSSTTVRFLTTAELTLHEQSVKRAASRARRVHLNSDLTFQVRLALCCSLPGACMRRVVC